jgi:hypothetical protein
VASASFGFAFPVFSGAVNDFGLPCDYLGMGSYIQNEVGARYVRTNRVRLVAPGVWEEIIRQYRRNNPHLPLALLASQLPDLLLNQIHDRQLEQKPVRDESI